MLNVGWPASAESGPIGNEIGIDPWFISAMINEPARPVFDRIWANKTRRGVVFDTYLPGSYHY